MSRLPEPEIKELNVNKKYDGVKRKEEHLYDLLADLFHEMHIKKGKENKEIA